MKSEHGQCVMERQRRKQHLEVGVTKTVEFLSHKAEVSGGRRGHSSVPCK